MAGALEDANTVFSHDMRSESEPSEKDRIVEGRTLTPWSPSPAGKGKPQLAFAPSYPPRPLSWGKGGTESRCRLRTRVAGHQTRTGWRITSWRNWMARSQLSLAERAELGPLRRGFLCRTV